MNKFVDLNEHVDCHLQFGASRFSTIRMTYFIELTIFEEDCMLARMPVQADIRRTSRPHYSTRTEREPRKKFAHPFPVSKTRCNEGFQPWFLDFAAVCEGQLAPVR